MVDFRKDSGRDKATGKPPQPDIPAQSLSDEVLGLIASGREFAAAEFAYQAARAKLMAKAAAWCAAGGGVALTLLFFVLIALVVGLLLALTPLLGAWGAMGAVVGGLLIAVLIAALVSWLSLRRFLALLRGKDKT